MANPIKVSELYKEDLSLEEAAKRWEMLGKAIDDVENKARKVASSLEKTNAATVSQRQVIDEASKQTQQYTKLKQRLIEAQDEEAVKIAALKEAIRQQTAANKAEARASLAKEGSYNKLSATYSLLKQRINQLTKEERENTKEGKELVKRSKEIFDEMKRLQEATGKTALNVGNYKDSVKAAIGEMKNAPGPLSSVAGGFEDIGTQAKALLRNPIVLFFAAIVGAAVGLFQAFKKTESGVKLLNKGSAILSATLDQLIVVAENVASAILSIVEDPKQAFEDFLNFIETRAINVFEGWKKAATSAVSSIGKALRGDFSGALGEAENALAGIGQALTTLTPEEIEALGEATKKLADEASKSADAYEALYNRQLQVRRANRGIAISIEQVATEEAKLRSIVDDSTKSFLEREQANDAAQVAAEKRARLELQLARNNASLINEEIKLQKGKGKLIEDLLDSRLEANTAILQAERELLMVTREGERERAQLQQDRLERDLDILIDGFDNQKSINERRIKDDKLSFEQRKALLEETNKLSDDSFAKQVQTIQQLTGVQINANELLAESDAVVLNKRIRSLGLSEIIEGRLLEVIRDRRTAVEDLSEAQTELLDAEKKYYAEAFKIAVKGIKDKKDAELEQFDQSVELEKARLDASKATEAEKTKFLLESEKERLELILKLNEKYAKLTGEVWTETQKETVEQQAKAVQNQIDDLGTGKSDIFSRLGLSLNDEQKTALQESFDYAKGLMNDFISKEQELAEQQVERATQSVEIAQNNLQIELANVEQGQAARVDAARNELDEAEKNRKKAIQQQQKAQRAQIALDSAQQASSLRTATANIFKVYSSLPIAGQALAVASIAAMYGSFAASRIRAIGATRQTFRKGTYEVLGGGKHESGNDTHIFTNEKGAGYAERGEGVGVFTESAVRKYGNALGDFVEAANKGVLEQIFSYSGSKAPSDNTKPTGNGLGTITGDIRAMRRSSQSKTYIDADGNTVEIYKNRKRVIA